MIVENEPSSTAVGGQAADFTPSERQDVNVLKAESWRDVLSLLSGELTAADRAGGWNEDLRLKWLGHVTGWLPSGFLPSGFLPSDAAWLLRSLQRDGITSGPIVDALADAKQGIPGVATPAAVAASVKEVARGVRRFSFKGSAPQLQRQLDDETLHLVHLQKIVSGVTGREPGFTVNLNVVHGALRRMWQQTGHWRSGKPVRSAVDTGIATRLGTLAFARDHWWRPTDDEEARGAAAEVLDLFEIHALPWFDRLSNPHDAIDWLLAQDGNFVLLEVAGALLAERPHDGRRADAERALRSWSPRIGGEQRPVLDWLLGRLKEGNNATEPPQHGDP